MVFAVRFVVPESPVFEQAVPRMAGQEAPVCQAPTLGMVVPRMAVRAILVPHLFCLVVLVMTLVTVVPLVAHLALLFFWGVSSSTGIFFSSRKPYGSFSGNGTTVLFLLTFLRDARHLISLWPGVFFSKAAKT